MGLSEWAQTEMASLGPMSLMRRTEKVGYIESSSVATEKMLIGRPLGDDAFLDAISRRLNRVVTYRERGRKPKGDVAGAEPKG